jgi:DNA-binding transcriptional LysR family regulator
VIRISLKQLEYFQGVMEAGTVSGAAALLNVSQQPNVSRTLKYTESRLGIRLFERCKGRLQPRAALAVAHPRRRPDRSPSSTITWCSATPR